tara:strand:+ start:1134 stop:1574 length:441 start_codon:yes stop_codon:yes gene_type:complete
MRKCNQCSLFKEEEEYYFRHDGSRSKRLECKACYLEKDHERERPPHYERKLPAQHGFNGWSGFSIALIHSAFKALSHEDEDTRWDARIFLEDHRGPWCGVMGADEDVIDVLLEKYDKGESVEKFLPQPSARTTTLYEQKYRVGAEL